MIFLHAETEHNWAIFHNKWSVPVLKGLAYIRFCLTIFNSSSREGVSLLCWGLSRL